MNPGNSRSAGSGISRIRGCSSMAELQLPKLIARVRFPSSAPKASTPSIGGRFCLRAVALESSIPWAPSFAGDIRSKNEKT